MKLTRMRRDQVLVKGLLPRTGSGERSVVIMAKSFGSEEDWPSRSVSFPSAAGIIAILPRSVTTRHGCAVHLTKSVSNLITLSMAYNLVEFRIRG